MPPPKKKSTGIGKALIRDRFHGVARRTDGSINRHTTEMDDGASWTKRGLNSVTQETDLEEFLNNATLAGTEFTAERLNVRFVDAAVAGSSAAFHTPSQETATGFHHEVNNTAFSHSANSQSENSLEEDALQITQNFANTVLTQDQRSKLQVLHGQLNHRLTVPRRPKWDASTTPEQLQQNEKEAFLNWRRSLVDLEETEGLILTPFERNLEVWRQMWRVLERSDLVVMIIDARCPLFYRNKDVEAYVQELSTPSAPKNFMLLVNKADMLTPTQRAEWGRYFKSQGVEYVYFSAALAKKRQEEEERRRQLELTVASREEDSHHDAEESDEEEQSESEESVNVERQTIPVDQVSQSTSSLSLSNSEQTTEPKKKSENDILDSSELLIELIKHCPPSTQDNPDKKPTIGLLGYPNVGKSSTLNAVFQRHLVSVSSTPGKTKHFQTHHLPQCVICDCPGLVFPSFAVTKADMTCLGVLPIDTMRDWTAPMSLVAERIPKNVLEAVYGIRIRTLNAEGIECERKPTAYEFAAAVAVARGFRRGTQGQPDESRASRGVLKDYVNGKLLYVHPPPTYTSDAAAFNRDTFRAMLIKYTRKKEATQITPTIPQQLTQSSMVSPPPSTIKSQAQNDSALHSVLGHTSSGVRMKGFNGAFVNGTRQANVIRPDEVDKKHKKGKRSKKRDKWVDQ